MFFVLFIAFLFMMFLSKSVLEGFRPNEDKFVICKDEITKGETNYTKETNHLKAPLKGFYSSIIKLTEEKNLPNYYQSPHCKSMKSHKNDYFNDNKIIDISNNNWDPPLDPFDKHAKPDDNYSLLYPDEYSDNFEYQHTKENKKEILSRADNLSN
ncbi:MAG: hypothetical protein CL470_01575 [Acidimicrobiaceae bacterium]|nr:hypothetical protein [Acidimicrobiaceae bacterium]